ncbi:Gldg family protein [Gayadomonas joobiniege]|uniref:Gldg family protein n=1 Tax=Gayadomonas joobiniege TaxID=1234606 RepID=UPI00037F5773|nr:Gldg family protein [Gayadomonas joobiniege]
MKKIQFIVLIAALFILFFGAAYFNDQYLTEYRADLTEGQVYSLSDGSKKILKKIDEPIHLYFYFSDKTSAGLTQLRSYADRVEHLLKTYQQNSGGKIKLSIIDPEPFSEAEDQAASFNLSAAPIGPQGESIYFGLAARNAVGEQDSIAFFDPNQEAGLEYDISRLLYQLINPEKAKITLISDLNISGQSQGMNPMMAYNRQQPWAFYQQLRQNYQVELLSGEAESLPEETDLLILIQANQLSDELAYQIDQYVMAGGHSIIFVDPNSESDFSSAYVDGSATADLLAGWGLKVDLEHVVLDMQNALEISSGNGGSVRHPGYLGLTSDNISNDSLMTEQLETLNGASFGAILKDENQSYQLKPLLTSSNKAILLEKSRYFSQSDPAALPVADGEQKAHILAALVQGTLDSAYTDTVSDEQKETFIGSQQEANLVLVMDTDLLSDRFWVRKNQLFNQTILTPFADNGSFVANLSEFMSGDPALISIRARGRFSRPFEKVKDLQLAAEAKFRSREAALQQELQKTEQKLTELQQSESDGALLLSAEQEQAINDFIQQRNEIRQQLRQVRHQLNKDIESLGSWLKLLNVVVAPLVLTLLLFVLRLIFKRRKLAA